MQYSKKNCTFLIGKNIISKKTTIPFDKLICKFFDKISKAILKNDKAKKYPDLITFGFWCRNSNILKIKNKYSNENFRIGLGLIFHITPTNIPINFAYSFAFGVLAGNSNIVRVPSKNYEQVTIFCEIIKKILIKKEFKMIKEMNTFVKYNYSENENLTKYLSSICEARIVWGGDASIQKIKKYPISVRAREIFFSDRYSLSILNISKISKLNKKNFDLLLNNFYNDTYLVDQNACSSPHLILWIDADNNSKTIIKKFWNKLSLLVKKKYKLQEISSIDKYNQQLKNVIKLKELTETKNFNNYVNVNTLSMIPNNIENLRGKWGFFYEHEAKNLSSLKNIINSKFQTITYFGIEKEVFKNFFLKEKPSGIDRVVTVGKALDIDIIWDGYDLIQNLSRIVDLR